MAIKQDTKMIKAHQVDVYIFWIRRAKSLVVVVTLSA